MIQDSGTLLIDAVDVPRAPGRIGMCACPGGRRLNAQDYDPSSDLARDLVEIDRFGATGILSLMEDQELGLLGLWEFPHLVARHELWWLHLPIRDMGVPDQAFEARWEVEGPRLRERLRRGENLVIHCMAGLGRTGTITARLLIEMGMEPDAAILRVRDTRPGTIQNRKQERYVERVRPVVAEST